MFKTTQLIAAVVVALSLTGCGQGAQTAQVQSFVQTPAANDETPAPVATVTPGEEFTAAGEVCDPHNANDLICAAFHPDQAVLNMTSAPRAGEPLASLSEEDRIALARQACDQLDGGADQDSVALIETGAADSAAGRDNNFTLASAGSLAYCNDHIELDGFRSILDQYKALGEAAAKESFADGVALTP